MNDAPSNPQNDADAEATLVDDSAPVHTEGNATATTTAPKIRGVGFVLKALLSAFMAFWIIKLITRQSEGQSFAEALSQLRYEWLALGLLVHIVGTSASLMRWRELLIGQGIHAPIRFLGGSLLIARFFGAVTPGGHLGFGGWRIYDIAKHTGKTARATATIAVEMVIGQLAFGTMVMLGSIGGLRFLGARGVLLANLLFGCVIVVGLLFLSKPHTFLRLANVLPKGVRTRVQTLVDALSAYRGKSRLLLKCFAFAAVTHACHFLIYVCTAQALRASHVGPGEVFFGSGLQILATMVPISINGIGLRETTAMALYTALGEGAAVSALIAALGFATEMCVSLLGAPIFLVRKSQPELYAKQIRVDDADREMIVTESLRSISDDALPSVREGMSWGLVAGLLAGVLVGLGESLVVIAGSSGDIRYSVIPYGVVAYAIFLGIVGTFVGIVHALFARGFRTPKLSRAREVAFLTASMVAGVAFGLTAFRVRRDFYREELVWKSLVGLKVLAITGVAAALLFVVIRALVGVVFAKRESWLTPPRTTIATALFSAVLIVGAKATPNTETTARVARSPLTAGPHNNMIVIVVDTLRADHLRVFNENAQTNTPALDAFAADATVFRQAFSNASWTRPSFASIMTGRYARSHGVMAKSDALPSDITTMAEAFGASGYQTLGLVTNYNVAPYFNFQQGFDRYRYLEPTFVLGADDSAAKLLLVQFLRQKIETVRDRVFGVLPGTAYQDAEVVNRNIFSELDRRSSQNPFLLFVGYMDPHDPYMQHPYNGVGYSRAAHQTPNPDEATHLESLYQGEIEFWDTHFGALIEGLRSRGLYDNTTIVVTADHGEEFGEHGGFWHGTTLYDEQTHVPLIVKFAHARQAGTSVDHWVQSIDLMPTLLRECGIAIPSGVQGGNLLEGSTRLFAEESHEGNILESVRERSGTDEWKLITANPNNPRHLAPVEVYRVDLDPAESEDLAHYNAEQVAAIHGALDEIRTQAATGALHAATVELDAERRRQLCALGYLTGEACQH